MREAPYRTYAVHCHVEGDIAVVVEASNKPEAIRQALAGNWVDTMDVDLRSVRTKPSADRVEGYRMAYR